MKGSAFIVHNNTWSCSNECDFTFHSEPIIENNKLVSTKRFQVVTIQGQFNVTIPPNIGDKCEIVILSDDDKMKYGFIGNIRSISKIQTVINIFTKTDRISEILSNITFKN